jgi:P pilus assembly chaperone PapD
MMSADNPRPGRNAATILLCLVGIAMASGVSGGSQDGMEDATAGTAEASSDSALSVDPTTPAAPAAHTLGGLLVAPTRLVFEGRQRTGQLTLVNTGAQTATYRISLVRLRMTETGAFRQVQEPDSAELFADTLVRFSPRRVELPPGVPQTVRLQLRLPADLPVGEYRSHLLFRAVPVSEPEDSVRSEPVTDLQLTLRAVYGVSIPIIVRHGALVAEVTLSDSRVESAPDEDPPTRLAVTLNRSGDGSVYGNLTAVLVRDGQPDLVVGVAKGLAVYTPNTRRTCLLSLRLPPSLDPQARLRVRFESASGVTKIPSAEASVALR